jgi:NAD(P)-dependent dehydrogenase (short-subunit alcohol dehydrogenase family)
VGRLDGKVVWVTGAGSGIGEAAAAALAREGAGAVLTGRRREPLEAVATRIGAPAGVEPGDVTVAADVGRIAAAIEARHGRLDVLVANAGMNVLERDWAKLTPAAAEAVLDGNLTGPFLCALAVLPIMRAQGGGLLVHTASVAGRVVGLLSGPAYTAAKHGLVAMSHSINLQECVNGIRSCAILPGEVATPILDRRPVPVGEEERARMLRPEDVADLIVYVAGLPPHVVVNEVMITPAWNRTYVGEVRRAGL